MAASSGAGCGVAQGTNGSPAEALLQGKTYGMLGERAQLQKDHAFLRHYADMSRHSAEHQEARAFAAAKAVDEQSVERCAAQQDLAAARAQLDDWRARYASCGAALQHFETQVAFLAAHAAREVAALRTRMHAEELATSVAAQRASAVEAAVWGSWCHEPRRKWSPRMARCNYN